MAWGSSFERRDSYLTLLVGSHEVQLRDAGVCGNGGDADFIGRSLDMYFGGKSWHFQISARAERKRGEDNVTGFAGNSMVGQRQHVARASKGGPGYLDASLDHLVLCCLVPSWAKSFRAPQNPLLGDVSGLGIFFWRAQGCRVPSARCGIAVVAGWQFPIAQTYCIILGPRRSCAVWLLHERGLMRCQRWLLAMSRAR